MVRKRGNVETTVSLLILALLVVIAGGVIWKQSRYDPRVFTFSFDEHGRAVSAGSSRGEAGDAVLVRFMPAAMFPFSSVEEFHSENLSDKINGKAEFYLSAGFLNLVAQRFAAESLPGQWMEVFLYDMGDSRNAFAVYSGQKRSGAEELDLTPFAYRTDNAIFFAHGSHYVEIVASVSHPAMQELMLDFARNMVREPVQESGALQELDLLPREGLQEDSVYLISSDAFGFDALDNVLTAQYALGDETFTAFLSLRASPEEAENLASSFAEFLDVFGAKPLPERSEIPSARVLQVFDTYEVILHQGNVLYGVHDAPNLESALELAKRMRESMMEVGR